MAAERDVVTPESTNWRCLGRVLVIDDDEAVGLACARMLEREGWEATLSTSGRSAIEQIQRANPQFDCVLSDVNMPELGGFELVQSLRSRDDDIPVVLMTGDPTIDGAVLAIENGAASYLAKPFQRETLAAEIARAAKLGGVRRSQR